MKNHLAGIFAFAALAALAAGPAFSADASAAGRATSKKYSDAVVSVRLTQSVRAAMEGRELERQESVSTATATVIDPSGLAVMSYMVTNPADMFERMGMSSQMSLDISVTDVKIRFADGSEVSAQVVLRDKDLDLAFVRPTEPLAKPAVHVNLAQGAPLALLDSVVVLGRLGKAGNWVNSAALAHVEAVIEKPRTFYSLSLESDMSRLGAPVFSSTGKPAGILLVRSLPMAAGGGSLFAQDGGDTMILVVLPAADVLESARQAPPVEARAPRAEASPETQEFPE